MLKKLFSPSGRVNRLQNLGYELLGLISMWVVGAFLAFAVFGIMYLVGVDNKSMTLPSGSELLLIFLLPTLVAMYSNIIIKIKRLHDMNLSGWWLPIFLLLVIPYIALYFWPGTEGKNRFDEDNDKTINNSNASLTKAVYNHAKDIAAEVKPAISEYKQKHATSQIQVENQDVDLVDEDAIYEQVMLEIEEDRKVKSTWAKALAQSDGDREKTEALYIKLRVQNIIEATQEKSLKNSEAEIKVPESTSLNTVEKEERKEEGKNQFVTILFFIIFGAILVFFYTRDTQQSQDIRSSVAPKQDTYEKVAPVVKEKKLLRMVHNKKKGFIDEDGNWIIKPIYDHVSDFSEELAMVFINKKVGFINKKGNLVIQPVYDNAGDFTEGLAAVKIDKKYGFIDKKGNLVIQPVYDEVRIFGEGLAAVSFGTKWGFIDKNGNLVIQPIYDSAHSFKEGLALVRFGDIFAGNSKEGFIDKKGNLVIQPVYDDADDFSEGLAKVLFGKLLRDGKVGFIDKKGNMVIQPVYDGIHAHSFSDGLASVGVGKKEGFIDKKGNMVIQPVYDDTDDFSEGMARVEINKKYGFIDKKGNLVIQPIYDEAYTFRDGLALAVLNKKIFYINKKGEVVITPKPVL